MINRNLTEEIIGVVNDRDEIVRTAPRREVHEFGLLHREVYVFLISPAMKKVLLQQRADGGKWNASAAGHFAPEESYLQAAQREFSEELGIFLPERLFVEARHERFTTNYNRDINDRFAKVYVVKKDISLKDFIIDPNEVAQVKYFDNHQAYNLMKEKAWMTHATRELMKSCILRELE